MHQSIRWSLGITLALLVGCADYATHQTSETLGSGVGEIGASSLALIVDVPAETDVVAMRITVHRVPCGLEDIMPEQFTVEADLEGPLPGGLVPGSAAAGLDPADEYFFLDNFWVLPAGCMRYQGRSLASTTPAA